MNRRRAGAGGRSSASIHGRAGEGKAIPWAEEGLVGVGVGEVSEVGGEAHGHGGGRAGPQEPGDELGRLRLGRRRPAPRRHQLRRHLHHLAAEHRQHPHRSRSIGATSHHLHPPTPYGSDPIALLKAPAGGSSSSSTGRSECDARGGRRYIAGAATASLRMGSPVVPLIPARPARPMPLWLHHLGLHAKRFWISLL